MPHCEKQPGRPPPHLAAQGRGNRTRHEKPRKTDGDTKRNGQTEIWNDEKQTNVNIRLWEADRSRYEETQKWCDGKRSDWDIQRRETDRGRKPRWAVRPRNETINRITEIWKWGKTDRDLYGREQTGRERKWQKPYRGRKRREADRDTKRQETERDANWRVADRPRHRPTWGKSGRPRFEVTRYRHSEKESTTSVMWNRNINNFDWSLGQF